MGKDEWDKWSGDPNNKGKRITFANVDFREAKNLKIHFTDFVFREDADFSGCEWPDAELTHIPDAFEPGLAYFTRSQFVRSANFTSANFRGGGIFSGTSFGDEANFTGAIFGNQANFSDAEFRGLANFTRASFGDGANFLGTAFRDEAQFEKAHFEGRVAFNRQRIAFISISFAEARFDGEANFSGRAFDKIADFTKARFYYPPDFDDVNNAGKIDFTGARVRFIPAGKWRDWTENSRIPVRLRAFRKIAEETKNHDLERDLYITEREAERGVYLRQLREDLKNDGWRHWPRNLLRLALQGLWVFIMFLYWVLSNYGRNPVLPFVWLGLSVPFFHWRYSKVLAPLMHDAGPANVDKYNHAIWMLAFGNAVPFVGPLTIDTDIKKFLFCPSFGNCLPMPPGNFQIWLVVQNVVSIILVFFIGLALRNYFKIK
jgi:uncharacterized protein YjbI with pentapeptide repeats